VSPEATQVAWCAAKATNKDMDRCLYLAMPLCALLARLLAPSHGTLEATEHALSVCVGEGGDRRVLYFALRHAPTRRACVLAVAKPDHDKAHFYGLGATAGRAWGRVFSDLSKRTFTDPSSVVIPYKIKNGYMYFSLGDERACNKLTELYRSYETVHFELRMLL
jgi:hypothetical protein